MGLALYESRNLQALVNLGYLTLLKRWASAAVFRRAAAISLESGSPAFQALSAHEVDLKPASPSHSRENP